jgi:ATP-dependent Clp protease adaptor protein ClpS
MPPEDPKKTPDRKGDVAVEEKPKLEKARRYMVIFHNDDYTTREFVVLVLMKFFNKSETEATHIMLSVHHKGRGVAGVYSRDIAESKVDQVHRYAEAHGFPLRLSAEPAED